MNRRLVLTLAATTAFEAIRAGAGTFRVLLDLPARGRIGPIAFAQLSRATDLSTAGKIFYVTYGIGGAALTLASWLVAVRAKAPRAVRRLTAVSALCSLAILGLTAIAAPLMWRIGDSPDDPVLLANLLDRFTFWTVLRVGCADLSFAAMLAALTIIALRATQPAQSGT